MRSYLVLSTILLVHGNPVPNKLVEKSERLKNRRLRLIYQRYEVTTHRSNSQKHNALNFLKYSKFREGF